MKNWQAFFHQEIMTLEHQTLKFCHTKTGERGLVILFLKKKILIFKFFFFFA